MREATFVSHLEEFRQRFIFAFCVFVACTVVCYYFSHELLDFLIEPLKKYHQAKIYFQTPYEAFLTHVKVAAIGGLIFSSPCILAEIWLFVLPALHEHEKKAILPLVFFSTLLFLTGVAFAFFLVIPFGIKFLLGFQTESLQPLLTVSPYMSFLVGMVLAFGILFNFPVAMVGSVRLGVVSTETLAKARKFVIVGIFVTAAVLTPSPDPVSQLLLAGPLWFFFEISLKIAGFFEKKPKSDKVENT